MHASTPFAEPWLMPGKQAPEAARPRPERRFETKVIAEDEDLRISLQPGRESGRLVVAFAGVRLGFGGMRGEEFAGSGSGRGRDAVLFVADKRRSWFSAPGLAERIAEAVAEQRQRVGAEETLVIGNSMGAYGAILLAGLLNARSALAFGPQATMDLSVLNERRWQHWRGGLPDRLARHPGPAIAAAPETAFYVFHGMTRPEMRQARLFPEAENLRHYLFPRQTHSVADAMKEAGVLDEIVQGGFARDDARVDAAVAVLRGRRRASPRRMERLRLAAADLPTPVLRRAAAAILDPVLDRRRRRR